MVFLQVPPEYSKWALTHSPHWQLTSSLHPSTHLSFHNKPRSPSHLLPSSPWSLSLGSVISSLSHEGLLIPQPLKMKPELSSSTIPLTPSLSAKLPPYLNIPSHFPPKRLHWLLQLPSGTQFPRNLKATTELLPRLCRCPVQNLPVLAPRPHATKRTSHWALMCSTGILKFRPFSGPPHRRMQGKALKSLDENANHIYPFLKTPSTVPNTTVSRIKSPAPPTPPALAWSSLGSTLVRPPHLGHIHPQSLCFLYALRL